MEAPFCPTPWPHQPGAHWVSTKNEAADGASKAGTMRVGGSHVWQRFIANSAQPPDLCPAVPTLSLDHALYWTQIDTILDPLNYSTVHSNAKSQDIVHLHVATANVLTLYRLDRAYESMEASLHIIGIQEPRVRDPCPWNATDYEVFASRATDRGAGGCELLIRKAQISDLKVCQVLLAQPRRLVVKLSCCFGVLRCVVLHGLDGSS